MRVADASVADLLTEATSREPLKTADSLSGAKLERVVIDGESYVLKHFALADDWLLRVSGDAGCRAVALWEAGLYDALPACIDSTVVGAAREPDGQAALLMHDVADQLVSTGHEPISYDVHRGFVADMAAFHAHFWGWSDDIGLMPMSTRYLMLTPRAAAAEVARGVTDAVPNAVGPGWARLDDAAPRCAKLVHELLDDPWPLVEALDATPRTFLHGDWKFGNLGRHADGRTILLDWDRPGAGAATTELAWYLAVNCDRIPESKEDTIAAYRQALERSGIDTGGWWDRQLPLALLGGFLSVGWSKTHQPEELGWWEDRVLEAADLL